MLDSKLRDRLKIPAVCAPMMFVSGPELVAEACKSGLMAGLPSHNARDIAEFDTWLSFVQKAREQHLETTGAIAGELAVNLSGKRTNEEIEALLDLCVKHRVEFIINAMGNPAELVKRARAREMKVFHDIVSIAHAEKAIAAGVDGLICIGAGGGGHSGSVNHFALVPRVREMFDGTIVLAGAVSNGAGIRAAEILGADLCYLGTRFIATKEARAPDAYKTMLVEGGTSDLLYTPQITGVAANWLKASLRQHGLDPENLPASAGVRNYDHLPEGVRPWRDLWSGGQGMEMIHDVPSVAELTARLCTEYEAACRIPSFQAG